MPVSMDGGSDFSFSLQLPPPDDKTAGQYANKDVAKFKVVQGNGQLVDAGDTMTSYDSIKTGATSLDIRQMVQLGVGLGNAEKLLQQQLDNLNAGDPQIPVLKNEINLINQMVNGSVPPNTLINLGINPNTGDVDTISVSSKATVAASAQTASGANKWFGGNAYVAFQRDFNDLIMMMMRGEAVEAKIAQASLQLGFALAQESSQDVYDSAQQRSQQQFVQGWTDIAAGAISIAGGLAQAGMSASMEVPEEDVEMTTPEGVQPNGFSKGDPNTVTRSEPVYQLDENGALDLDAEGEPVPVNKTNAAGREVDAQGRVIPKDPENPDVDENPDAGDPVPEYREITRPIKGPSKSETVHRNQQLQAKGQAISQVASGVGQILKGWGEMQGSQYTLNAGIKDADKVIVDAILKNIQEQQAKALELFKSNQDYIEQIFQSLKTWFDQYAQGLQAALKRAS